MADLDGPRSIWPDPFTAAISTAAPHSKFFQEFIALAIRAGLDKPSPFFAAADVGSVIFELGIDHENLAIEMGVPPAYMYAVVRGWHRLGLRGLALMAEALDVPLAAFVLDKDGAIRDDVRRYARYRRIASKVTILGS